MSLDFSGTRLLLLGGSSDIAIALARIAMDVGLYPFLSYRDEKGLGKIIERLESYSGRFKSVFLEFGDRDSLKSLMNEVDQHIDIMVDFVQGSYESLIAASDEDTIYDYFDRNISFRAELLKKVSRIMMNRKNGRMVFISSTASERTNPGQGFYAAAKLASEALYRTIGIEMANYGISTVSIRPGYIDAGRGKEFVEKKGRGCLEKVPLKRALTENELARTILFYLSDSAKGFNAVEITMDGGLSAGK